MCYAIFDKKYTRRQQKNVALYLLKAYLRDNSTPALKARPSHHL